MDLQGERDAPLRGCSGPKGATLRSAWPTQRASESHMTTQEEIFDVFAKTYELVEDDHTS